MPFIARRAATQDERQQSRFLSYAGTVQMLQRTSLANFPQETLFTQQQPERLISTMKS